MASVDILFETFNMYFAKAKENYEQGNLNLAKTYYQRAAEQMLKLALNSKGDLRTARYNRAKSLINIADSIVVGKKLIRGKNNNENDLSSGVNVQQISQITLEEALDNLNKLVGLKSVKEQVNNWVNERKAFQLRMKNGLSVPNMTNHLVFLGNAGTGKTTVARIIAQICFALGMISKGQLVEVTKEDLVAGYVGQTALKTKDVVMKSIGGVLFIDEAYRLSNASANDFGREAIDTLIKLMEDNRNDLIVIVAGYDEEMKHFINSNSGLQSRFKNYITFEDYTSSELFQIFVSMCKKENYQISNDLLRFLPTYFDYLYSVKTQNMGNGRAVRNLFENVISAQAGRISNLANPTIDQLTQITYEDFINATNFRVNKTDSDGGRIMAKGGENDAEDAENPEKALLKNPNNVINSEFVFDWDSLPTIHFEDVAGLDDVKEVVRNKVLLPLTNPEAFDGYVKKNGGGLLLYGPPGSGKTMIAAAIANEIGAKFCSVKPSDLLHQGAGQSEKAVRTLFAQARSFPCSVIYFDEMESISPKNTKSQYAKQLRSELLAQLQGIDSYGKETNNILFLIAATNKPWDIDSAFIRPGRFGTRVYVGLPDSKARRYIIEHRLEKIINKGIVSIKEDVSLDEIVSKTEGFNGSDISNLLDKVEEISIVRGLDTGEKFISNEDFISALNTTRSSVQREDIERLLEWKNIN